MRRKARAACRTHPRCSRARCSACAETKCRYCGAPHCRGHVGHHEAGCAERRAGDGEDLVPRAAIDHGEEN